MSKQKLKSIISTIAKIFFASLVVYWLVSSGKFDLESFKTLVTPSFFIKCFICVMMGIFINNFRWHLLLKSQSVNVSIYECFRLSLIGMFFNFTMPGGVGGDIVKAYYLVKETKHSKSSLISTVFLDRVIGFAVMAMVALCSILFYPELLNKNWEIQSLAFFLVGIIFCFFLLILLSVSQKAKEIIRLEQLIKKMPMGDKFQKVLDSFSKYGEQPSIFLKSIGLSVLSQSFLILATYLTAVQMGIELSLNSLLFAVPLGLMAVAIPVAPAGVGVGQAAFLMFFGLVGVRDPHIGVNAITVIQIMQFCSGLIGGYYYIMNKKNISLEKISA